MTVECIFDTETRSSESISYGTDKYMSAAQPLLLTWCLTEQENIFRRVVHVHQFNPIAPTLPPAFEEILADPNIPLVAHNAPFDRRVVIQLCKRYVPVTRFRCTRAQAYAHGLPGALESLPAVLGLPSDTVKFSEPGKRLIQLFCVPYAFAPDGSPHYYGPETHPQEWIEFREYAIQDTRSLREVRRALPTVNYSGRHLTNWHLDQMINERGFGFDAELAEAARDTLDKGKARMRPRVTEATDGAVEMPTQRKRLLAWLESKGIMTPNLRAATVRDLLDADDLDPMVRFVLEARLEASKSSGAKYGKGLSAQVGGRIRHCIQFSGAGRTGRYSHKIFQPGNMMRPVANGGGKNEGKTVPVSAEYCLEVLVPGIKGGLVLDNPLLYDEPHTACANALRCAIEAAPPGPENPDGNELIDADYSGIEARGAAWLAGEEWLLEAYRAQDLAKTPEEKKAADSYIGLVMRFFGLTLEEVNNHWRQIGKVVRLSMQYGAGVGGLVTMAAQYNMDLDAIAPLVLERATPEQMKKADKTWVKAFLGDNDFGLKPDTYRACDVLKQVYREAEKRVTQVRYDIDKAVAGALENPGTPFHAARSTMFYTPGCLAIVLPSGRRLLYWRPEYIKVKEIDPETLEESERKVLTFMTPRGKNWMKEKAWSGLFFNNIDQGHCNDMLRDGLMAVHKDTLTVEPIARYLSTLPPEQRTAICLHVHDAITVDVPRGSYSLERMTKTMVAALPYAEGFPIAADGWVGPRYHYK